jgi:perosamine synthetase
MIRNTEMFKELIELIRVQYPGQSYIPLHEPRFTGNERAYVMDSIDSTFVSSVGEYVNRFERMMSEITGSPHAVATSSGTSALHVALILAEVKPGEEVITQALTFVATTNAISYVQATPVFIDIDEDTLGMSPDALRKFLHEYALKTTGGVLNKKTNRRISACLPMHTFGFPCRIDELQNICDDWGIPLIEDSAESIGSSYKGKQTGTFGKIGTFSFNGNKTVTCGGGGVIVTNEEGIAKLAKHITTQAKVPHEWNFFHDQVGYNYRMPNLNAALACAQLEMLDKFLNDKRELASIYRSFFTEYGVTFVSEIENANANYWLNTVICKSREERDQFLQETNSNRIMTRPAWTLMSKLPMYLTCQNDGLKISEWIEERLVNIPSSVRIGSLR